MEYTTKHRRRIEIAPNWQALFVQRFCKSVLDLQIGANFNSLLMPMVDLMIHLRHGREPSMYVEIRDDTATVQLPSNVVRKTAVHDCLRLASQALAYARKHVAETTPRQWTLHEDELFAMKNTEYQKIMNTADFWWYYIAQLESGQKDFARSVVCYRKEFFLNGIQFQPAHEECRNQ